MSIKSILNKIWKQAEFSEDNAVQINKYFSKDLKIDYITSILLSQKNVKLEAIEAFINPKIKNHLVDPYHLLDMKKAVSRIIKSINNKEKICVFGDYDVDGATSSALLKNVFSEIGIEIDVYIPDRIAEGYGPNNKAFQQIKNSGVDIIITVDCGTSSKEPIDFANSIGIEVIVIDHHLSTENLPNAHSIINPNRLDQKSEYKHLCAAGVCFLFLVALIQGLREKNYFIEKNTSEPNLLKYLDLVALGTVCDVMELRGINRAFVHQGLKIINKRLNLGIKSLIDISSVFEPISSYHLGFILGPKINAGGRVGKSDTGSILLSTKCEKTANNLSLELSNYNEERKLIENQLLIEALKLADEQLDKQFIFITLEDAHIGIIGIIAGRLKEKFEKPSIVISFDSSNGIGKASCRSINGVDIGTKIANAYLEGILLSGGGHAAAAGFSVERTKLDEFYNYLEAQIKKDFLLLSDSYIYCKEYKEYVLDLCSSQINNRIIESISKLEPYGQGNQEQLIKIKNLFIYAPKIISGKHLVCSAKSQRGKIFSCIAFNSAESEIGRFLFAQNYQNHQSVSIIGFVKRNNFSSSIQIVIKDIICETVV